MPAKERGSVVKRGATWQARYRDEHGKQRGQGGFATKTAAADWLDDRTKDVLASRRGERIPVSHRPATVDALLGAFLERHGATVDTATKRKLTRRYGRLATRSGQGTRIR
jgi:hypothetical protein